MIYTVRDLAQNAALARTGLDKLKAAFARFAENRQTYPLVYESKLTLLTLGTGPANANDQRRGRVSSPRQPMQPVTLARILVTLTTVSDSGPECQCRANGTR